MILVNVLMMLVPESISGRGAVQNCRRELALHEAARREADALGRRVAERRQAPTTLRRSA